MDSLMEKKLRAYLDGDAHRFENEVEKKRCYYCLGESTHTIDCPARGDGKESES